MQICVVAYKFGTEAEIGEHLGSYHYFIEKMRRLVRLGHKVYVIAPWLTFARKGSTEIDGVKVLRYYPPLFNRAKLFGINQILRFWYIRATQKRVLQLNRILTPDIIYVWQARETGFAVASIKEKLRAPFVFRQITAWQWHFQRGVPDQKSQMKFAKTIYDKADRIVFVSRAAVEEGITLGLSPAKARVIGIGIETEMFKPLHSQTELRRSLEVRGNKVILFIGRINFSEKGIGYLLEAMPKILAAIPNANLVIIGGGGETDRMEKLIQELHMELRVQLVGKKPFRDLPKYLNASDVLVVPSVWVEHFGQVTIEAMSCAIPVVTSDRGGSPEINIDGETGYVVPAARSDKIAEAVIRILRDEELQKRLGLAARQRVKDNYTYEILVNKFLETVKEFQKG